MEKIKLDIYRGERDRTLVYSNDMNEIPIGMLTASEAKIFIAACYRYQQQYWPYFQEMPVNELNKRAESYDAFLKEIPVLEISFKDLKKLSNYKGHDNDRFVNDLREMRRRLQTIAIERVYPSSTATKIDDGRYIIFPSIDVLETKKKMTLTGNLAFIRCLFGFYKSFTMIEIDEIMSLNSIYSIICYRQLKQWRYTGCWIIKYESFRRLLGLSDSYRASNIDQQITNRVIKELSPFFEDLKIKKNYDEKKQGKPITSIEFSFKPEKETEKVITCPVCGKPLVEKMINGSVCWCHRDGWMEDAECQAIFNSIAEIRGYEEDPERLTPEEHKEIITEELSRMFIPEKEGE